MTSQIRKLSVALVLFSLGMMGMGCRGKCVTCPTPPPDVVVVIPTPPPPVVVQPPAPPVTQPPVPPPTPPPPAPPVPPPPTPPPPTPPPQSACIYSFERNPQRVLWTGQSNGGLSVLTNPQSCAWTARSSAFWVEITQGLSGVGDGMVRYNVAANGGASRTATITLTQQDGRTIVATIVQDAAPGF